MDKEKDRNYWPYGRIGEGEPIIIIKNLVCCFPLKIPLTLLYGDL